MAGLTTLRPLTCRNDSSRWDQLPVAERSMDWLKGTSTVHHPSSFPFRSWGFSGFNVPLNQSIDRNPSIDICHLAYHATKSLRVTLRFTNRPEIAGDSAWMTDFSTKLIWLLIDSTGNGHGHRVRTWGFSCWLAGPKAWRYVINGSSRWQKATVAIAGDQWWRNSGGDHNRRKRKNVISENSIYPLIN